MRTLTRSLARALPALSLVSFPLQAQFDAPITVQVINAEEIGQSRSVDVLKSLQGVRTPIGTARPGSPVQLRALGEGFRAGTPISVTYHRNQLVLIDGRRPDPACLADLNALPAERCREIEVIRAGEGATYGVDAVAGVVNIILREPAGPALQVEPKPGRFQLGLDYSIASFNKLDAVACNLEAIPGLTDCTSDKSSSGFGVFGEYRVSDKLSLGLRYSYADYAVDQVYGDTPARHEVSVTGIDTYARYEIPWRPQLRPWFILGSTWYENDDEMYWETVSLGRQKESGFRFLGGAGFDYPVQARLNLRATVRYVTGGGHDADTNLGGGLGLSFNF